MKSQKDMVLEHLKQGPITPLEALNNYGCFRLSAVIFDLKADGYDIRTDILENESKFGKKHFARYLLTTSKQKTLF